MLPRFLLNLMTLNAQLLADQAVQVAHGAEVDLAAGQERAHADVDGEAALHALDDAALDDSALLQARSTSSQTFILSAFSLERTT